MNGFEAIAASLGEVADWAEDALAGGKPPRWVAQQGYERTRQIAYMATLAGDGKLSPAALHGILRGEQGDGETLTLGRLRPEPEPSGWRGWRAVRCVQRVLISAVAAVKGRTG